MRMLDRPIPLWLILLLGMLLWGGEYVRRDLWAPDEARFALVSKEMREGHWLVPYRQGEFYTHKPPLMFWLTNLFSLATGGQIGNVAPRLPSFLGAILALWAASRLATRWFSPSAGWLTVLFTATSFLFWNKGGFGQIDMLLCGLSMTALYFFFTANETGDRRRFAMAYAFTGLAVLAKGPVGFLIPWGIYLASTYFSGDRFQGGRGHLAWGPAVMLLFPGAWLLLAWWHGAPEGFFPELLFHQNVGRMTGEFGGHVKPFYYFLYYFPLDFLPWTLALPLSWHVLRRVPEADCARTRLLVWILFVILFFSLSASKRNLYILICYPAAAMLVAAAAVHWSRANAAWVRTTFRVALGFFALLAVVMIVAQFVPRIPFNTRSLIPSALLLAAGCVLAWRFHREQPRHPRWLVAFAGSALFAFASAGALVLPAFDDLKTPDEFVHKAHALLAPDERILMYRMHGEIFSLYAERKGYMAFSDEEAIAFLHSGVQTNHLILALEKNLPAIDAWLELPTNVLRFTSGSKEMVAIPVTPTAP